MSTDDVIIGGRYRLNARLGSGAFGVVWQADDAATGRTVAVKVLRAEHLAKERVRDRMLREAQILIELQHPNIARALDVVEHDGGLAIVLELIRGETLFDAVERRSRSGDPWSAREIEALAGELARGIGFAHERGIIHRDLQPHNIMLAPHVVILDFGLARFLEPGEEDQATTLGRVLGTPLYMPPEQADGRGSEPRSDLFALATILFEVATLRRAWAVDERGQPPPFHEKIDRAAKIANAPGSIVTRIAMRPERLDVRAFRSDLPAVLTSWILAASAVRPADRPSDVSSLLSGSGDEEDDDGDESTADLEAPVPRKTVVVPAPASDRWLVATSIGLALGALLVAWRLFNRESAAELPVLPIVVTSTIVATTSIAR